MGRTWAESSRRYHPELMLSAAKHEVERRQFMTKIQYLYLTAAAAVAVIACAVNPLANDAIATNTAERTAPAAPTKDALVSLERSAYDAWKSTAMRGNGRLA